MREEVYEMQGADAVEGLKGAEIAGEGGGVAGDVDECGSGDAREEFAGFEAYAGTRRVEDDEVGAVAIEDGAAQEVERGGLVDRTGGAAFGESDAEVGYGGGVGFDGGDLVKAAS